MDIDCRVVENMIMSTGSTIGLRITKGGTFGNLRRADLLVQFPEGTHYRARFGWLHRLSAEVSFGLMTYESDDNWSVGFDVYSNEGDCSVSILSLTPDVVLDDPIDLLQKLCGKYLQPKEEEEANDSNIE